MHNEPCRIPAAPRRRWRVKVSRYSIVDGGSFRCEYPLPKEGLSEESEGTYRDCEIGSSSAGMSVVAAMAAGMAMAQSVEVAEATVFVKALH